jgi:hypothetical protein
MVMVMVMVPATFMDSVMGFGERSRPVAAGPDTAAVTGGREVA